MPRFVDCNEVIDIRAEWWGEKETATIRKFNYGDRQYLAGQAVRVGIATGDGTGKAITDIEIGEMNLALIERGLVGWTDPDGEEMEVTRAAIEALTDEDGDFILGEIRAFNPRRRRGADEAANFPGGPGGGVPERDGAAAGA